MVRSLGTEMTRRRDRLRRPKLKALLGLPLVAVLAGLGLSPVPVASAQLSGAGHVVSGDWLGEVNYYRLAAGLAPVANVSAWDQGIRSHLVYLAKTPASYLSGAYASLHTENPASPYYTAAGAKEAASSNLFYGEVGFSPRDFIDGWLSAPFHAVGILRPQLKLVAFAYSTGTGDAGLDVISGLDYAEAMPKAPVLFPGPGAPTNLSLFRGESPDPLQTCGWQDLTEAVGLPLVMLLPSPPPVGLTARLARPGGVIETNANGGLCIVDSHTFVPSDGVFGSTGLDILKGDNAVFLVPRAPLTPGNYVVSVHQPGRPEITWQFRNTEPVKLGAFSGSHQSVLAGDLFTMPLEALLTDTNGHMGGPLDRARVFFTVTSGHAYFPGKSTKVMVTTDADGVALAPALRAGDVAGPVTVTASSPDIAARTTYNLVVRAG
ncbi:MAG: CAP domain-containing protein [Acidimicrobiales bacterium]